MPASRPSAACARAFRLIIAAVCLVGVETEPANGQSYQFPSVWQFGVRAEVVSSTVTDNLAGQTESLRGLGVAAQIERRVGGPVSARLELAYLPRGVRQELRDRSADGRSQTVTAETRLHYFSVPVFIQAGLEAGSSPVTLTALLGPRLDVLIGRRSGTFSFSDGDRPAGLADRYDRVTIGASGGLGIAVDAGAVTVTGELLQHRDITAPVDQGSTGRGTLTLDALRNVATGVSVGVRW